MISRTVSSVVSNSCIYFRSSNRLKYVIFDEIYERGLKKFRRIKKRSGNKERCAITYGINISSGGRGRLVTLTDRMPSVQRFTLTFFIPFFFLNFLNEPARTVAAALKQSARVAHSRARCILKNHIDLWF